MGRYDKLKHHLQRARGYDVDMTFKQIEAVLGRALPPSAHKHRAWWSNNPDNNVMTRAWLDAGYQSANVDIASQTLTFEVVVDAAPQQPAPVLESSFSVREKPQTGFVYRGAGFNVLDQLSPRAREWIDMKSDGDKENLVLGMIENMVAKANRKSIVAKYSDLKIGGGSNSVDLIREDRDGR